MNSSNCASCSRELIPQSAGVSRAALGGWSILTNAPNVCVSELLEIGIGGTDAGRPAEQHYIPEFQRIQKSRQVRPVLSVIVS